MDSPVPNLDKIGIKATGNLLHQLQREVAQLLGRTNHSFPGAQPISFARHHLRELKSRDYYLTEKSDGIRCLLYFTKDDAANGDRELHYLIDRKNNYHWIQGLHFPRNAEPKGSPIDWTSFRIDTLLDGELLWDDEPTKDEDGNTVRDETGKKVTRKVLKYLVFDCMILNGSNLSTYTLDKRLAYFHDAILAPYVALCKAFPARTDEFVFRLEKKDVQRAYGTEMMFRELLPALKHGSDGLIFTCRETPYKSGTDEHIVKWKKAEENSIDFKLDLRFPPAEGLLNGKINGVHDGRGIEDVELDYDALPTFLLMIHMGGDGEKEFGRMHVMEAEWEKMKNWAIEHEDGLDGQIVECYKDSEGRWRFGRFRDDKLEANHISTADKVMQSIDDGVTEEDLIAAARDIRTAWKERERDKMSADQRRTAEAEKRKRAEAEGRAREQAL